MDDFETIDDSVLAELMLDFPIEEGINTEYEDPNTKKGSQVGVPVPSPQNPVQLQNYFQEINTQFNHFQPRIPQMPQMFFPNSNVTINYNFKQ